MRILIDATSLLLRSAGIKSYAWHWLRSLRAISPPGSVGAFPMLPEDGGLDHEHSVLGLIPTYARLAALYGVNVGGPSVLELFTRGADVFHASNQVRVVPRNCCITGTIHDMTCWIMPEVHTEANVRADSNFAKNVLRHAARLIAVSENTRRDATRILGIHPDRIDVIYSGVDDRFFTAKPLQRDRPYVLFLGTIEPRKNLDSLLDAWKLVPRGVRDGFDLLIAGPAGWNADRTMARLAAKENGVQYLGYVPESSIPALTAGATVFAYTSLYEGFGFPVAQAMAAGVPILTSNASCLPEVAGESALLVDPRSPSEIATRLDCLMSNPALRGTLGAAGKLRATRLYQWSECARRSMEFFHRAIGK